MKAIQKIVVTAILVLVCMPLFANNIQITRGPEIVSRAADRVIVSVDVNWENSWRLSRPNNWDAAWIFMKYRIDAANWRHANLHATPNIVTGGGSTPNVVEYGTSIRPDGSEVNVGVFIYRSQQDTWGDMILNDVRLNWDTRDLGITATTVLSVRVFAIEMVYVPQGPFYIGDGWSMDHLRTIGDTMFSSTFTPFMGTAIAQNSRPDNIIPQMTSNVAPDGWVASVGTLGTVAAANPTLAWHAFNRTNGNVWTASATHQWEFIQIEMPTARTATWGMITRAVGAQAATEIRGFAVQGSNDGLTWTTVYGNPEFIHPNQNVNYRFGRNNHTNIPFRFENPGSFRFYRFLFNSTATQIVSIQLFEGDNSRINRIASPTQPTHFFMAGNAYPAANSATVATLMTEANLAPMAPGFPNGFNAFYVMKHEVTQHFWADFLNTLTWDQQHRLVSNPGAAPNAALPNVTPASVVGTNIFHPHAATQAATDADALHRMNIRIRERGLDGPAVFGVGRWVTTAREEEDPETGDMVVVTDAGWCWNHELHGGHVPMFNLAWTDVAAFLDWAGLRPMTELEYEKAARGPRRPVRDEFAWGGPFLPSMAARVENRNLPNETPLPVEANFAQPMFPGTVSIAAHAGPRIDDPSAAIAAAATVNRWPLRAGSFAREATTREEAGASYWGILNLSDNVPERVIAISSIEGRAFTGRHGDGEITAIGFANVPNWPSVNVAFAAGNGLARGTGFRGIAVSTGTTITQVLPVSWRQFTDNAVGVAAITTAVVNVPASTAAGTMQNHRDLWTGARGVRTCPRAVTPTGF